MTKPKNNKIKAVTPAAPIVLAKKEATRIGRGPTKTFQQDGHWIVKTSKTVVLLCECGNRYIKTRPQQVKCLRCMSRLSSDGR